MEIQTWAYAATVASPLVAAGIFAASAWIDRSSRRRDAQMHAIARFRGAVISAGNWTALPFPVSHFGGWQFRLLETGLEVALHLPRGIAVITTKWTTAGVTRMSAAAWSEERTLAQTRLLGVATLLQDTSRNGMARTLKYMADNPWPDEPPAQSRLWTLLADVGRLVVPYLSGDPTYGRPLRAPKTGRASTP